MLKFRIFKTYFLEILLLVALAIIVTIIMLSWFLNFNFERSTTNMVNQLNQDFLAETHRINVYLQKIIKISGMELFLEPSVQNLMYRDDLTNFEVVTGIRRLDAVMSTNIHVHSIYVYNATEKYIYTTSNIDSNALEKFSDQNVLELLSGSADHRRLAPIPRYSEGSGEKIPLYSFVFYDIQKTQPHIKGALVINITGDWLREIFQDDQDATSQVVFVDESGVIAYHSDVSLFLKNISDSYMFKTMVSSGEAAGYFILDESQEKFLVFYSKSSDEPLYLMRIYPYAAIMSGIMSMRVSTLLLVLACAVIALGIAVFISRRLYRPIHQIVNQVDIDHQNSFHEEGELRYLSSRIDRMVTQAETYEETTEEYRKQLQIDVLKEILMGKLTDPTLLEQQFSEYSLPFSPQEPMQLIALRFPSEEQILCSFENINCPYMLVPFDYHRQIVVAQMCDEMQVQEMLQQAKAVPVQLIVIDTFVEYPLQLASHTALLLEELRFSFLYPMGSEMHARNLKRSVHAGSYPSELERNLLQSVRQGRALEAYDYYEQFFEAVSLHAFSHFRFSMKRLFISLQLLVREMQDIGNFTNYREFTIGRFEQFLEMMSSAEELHEFFLRWFTRFEEELQRCRSEKTRKITAEIKQIIESEYANHNVCLQFIADRMNRSVSYISKVFKECEGVSVNDYCHHIRMHKATVLLAQPDVPVKDIALAVGFSNENYFYTVFRKQYGLTPNEYRKQRGL